MKTGVIVIKAICFHVTRSGKKSRRLFKPEIPMNIHADIPYMGDEKDLHRYDVCYADKDNPHYKNVAIIDFHGGSFLFGYRKNNYPVACHFLKKGFDYITADYIPMRRGRNMNDLVEDCAKCVAHIAAHKKELGLENHRFVLTGDSAGGLLVTLLQMANDDPSYAKLIGIDLSGLRSEALLLNCPVFDLVGGDVFGALTKSGQKLMFGKRSFDKEYISKYSPSAHTESLKSPVFVSTCKKDFIRSESVKVFAFLKKRKDLLSRTIDLDDDSIGHVHNIIDVSHPCSIEVNDGMADFIDEALKN